MRYEIRIKFQLEHQKEKEQIMNVGVCENENISLR